MKILNVYGLPELLQPESIQGETAVVIDVLRATTTVIAAIAAGVAQIVPVLEVEETQQLKARILSGEDPRFSGDRPVDLILGGERGGKRIDGFDLGNSPQEYTPERVGGKTLLFSTTNGTRAMYQVRLAEEVYLASFLNAQTVVEQLHLKERVHIVCAGTDGILTEEDLLLAGLLVKRLQRLSLQSPSPSQRLEMNVQAITALEMWTRSFSKKKNTDEESISQAFLTEHLRKSIGGRNLLSLGLGTDIAFAAQLDSVPLLARLHPEQMVITA